MFLEISQNFAKHLCPSLLFNKVRPATLLKKRLEHSCFLMNVAKFLRTSFSQNTSGRLHPIPLWVLVLKALNVFPFLIHFLWLFICCKTKLKKKFFFEKIFVFFTKYTLFAEKNVFIWKKSFIMKMFFTEKNFFYREKYKWKCKKYISHFRNIFLHRKCLCYK